MSHSLSTRRSLAVLVVALAAACPLPAVAQEAEGAKPKAEAEGSRPAFDPSAYWMLTETYRPTRDKDRPAPPGSIGQYRVDFRETTRITGDSPGGAPTLSQTVVEGRYFELPDEVEDIDDRVLSVVRRYGFLRHSDDPKTTPKPLPGMAGATFWIRHRPEVRPLVISLDPSKDFRFDSYHLIAAQVYPPDLALLLPRGAVRVGETYDLSREGSVALVGSLSWLGIENQKLQGKVVEIRPGAAGKPWKATIDLVGDETKAGIHAGLTFAFEPPAADELAKAGGKEDNGARIYARGAIVEVRMTTEMVTRRGNSRLFDKAHRELILLRSLTDTGDPIKLPEPTPEPNPANSWLTFIDPKNRYHLRIPQSLIYEHRMSTDDTAVFWHPTPDGNGREDLSIQCGTGTVLAPRDMLESALAQIRSDGFDVKVSPPGPPRTWSDFRVDVRQARIHDPHTIKNDDADTYLGYAIRGPGNLVILACARTPEPNAAEFRALVESILKTILPGAPKDR
ncbi:MAG TPA: hypothetical protein VG406_27910 [Isosphaeraceae bacterium]|jgi:hypothetical protein|nr:hypothetical protein [Isosphaeraceae bacterium]